MIRPRRYHGLLGVCRCFLSSMPGGLPLRLHLSKRLKHIHLSSFHTALEEPRHSSPGLLRHWCCKAPLLSPLITMAIRQPKRSICHRVLSYGGSGHKTYARFWIQCWQTGCLALVSTPHASAWQDFQCGLAGGWLAPQLCKDPVGTQRAEVHQHVADDAKAFFYSGFTSSGCLFVL